MTFTLNYSFNRTKDDFIEIYIKKNDQRIKKKNENRQIRGIIIASAIIKMDI